MGEQRIREVNMVALIFWLLGVIILLVAACRIWVDATPSDLPTIASATASSVGGSPLSAPYACREGLKSVTRCV